MIYIICICRTTEHASNEKACFGVEGGTISEVEVTDCLLCCVITLSIKREIAVSIFFDFFAYIFGYRLSMM